MTSTPEAGGTGNPLLDLFREESRRHLTTLRDGLAVLDCQPATRERLEGPLHAAHLLKGAARLVNLEAVVRVTEAMILRLETAANAPETVPSPAIAAVRCAVELLEEAVNTPVDDVAAWVEETPCRF